jgi:hypothetical protein
LNEDAQREIGMKGKSHYRFRPAAVGLRSAICLDTVYHKDEYSIYLFSFKSTDLC